MANTTNLNLAKPAGTDKALVSVLNSNSDKIDAWAGTTNQALSPYNLGTVSSLSALENALITFSNSLTTQSVRVAYAQVGFTQGVFVQTGYNFTVRKLDTNRCDVMAYRGNAIDVVVGNCLNGTWTWDVLALKSDINKVFATTVGTSDNKNAFVDWLNANNSILPTGSGTLVSFRLANYPKLDGATGILSKVSSSYGKMKLVSFYTALDGEYILSNGTWSAV
jgi:hypothetical protein